jgi:hypothetical protein
MKTARDNAIRVYKYDTSVRQPPRLMRIDPAQLISINLLIIIKLLMDAFLSAAGASDPIGGYVAYRLLRLLFT